MHALQHSQKLEFIDLLRTNMALPGYLERTRRVSDRRTLTN